MNIIYFQKELNETNKLDPNFIQDSEGFQKVTSDDKNRWDSKQQKLTAGANIEITSEGVIGVTGIVSSEGGMYLPLSGGEMQNTIFFKHGIGAALSTSYGNDDLLMVAGVTSAGNPSGPYIRLHGSTGSSSANYYRFEIASYESASANSVLIGDRYGSLTWCGEELATENFVKECVNSEGQAIKDWADNKFLTEHQSLSNYVTLTTAQTISGQKTFTNTINHTYDHPEYKNYISTRGNRTDRYWYGLNSEGTYSAFACERVSHNGEYAIGIRAGTDNTSKAWYNGPAFILQPAGSAYIRTTDGAGENNKIFKFGTDGSLTISGTIKTSSWNMLQSTVDNARSIICGGTAEANGASLILKGKSKDNGGFILKASNGTNSPALMGGYDGGLTWNGNSLVGEHNTPTAGTNVTIAGVTCNYTRVGNMVYVWGIPTFAAATYSNGDTFLSGLPANNGTTYGTGMVTIGNKTYRLRMNTGGTTITYLDSFTLSSSAYGAFTFMYLAA